jgi:Tfp pilus assembly PilM family ATPase
MFYKHFFTHYTIGLDIQPNAVHIVKLKKDKYGISLSERDSHPLATGVMIDDKICWDGLAQTLKSLSQTFSLNRYQVITHFPARLLNLQTLTLPKGFTDDAIQDEIHYRLKQELSMAETAVIFDYHRLPSKTPEQISLTFVAVAKQYHADFLSALQTANIRINIIDVDVYAMLRGISYLDTLINMNDSFQLIIIINPKQVYIIGFSLTHIIWHQNWRYEELSLLAEKLRSMPQYLSKHIKKIRIYTASQVKNHLLSVLNEYDCEFLTDLDLDYVVATGLALRGFDDTI